MLPSESASELRAPLPRPRSSPLVASLTFGITLARRGPFAVLAMVVSALTVLLAVAVALLLSRASGESPASSVPTLASSALAWGGLFLHAVSVSVGAFRRDRVDGMRALCSIRAPTSTTYLVSRVAGLAVVLVVVGGSGTLLVSVVSLAAATNRAQLVLAAGSSLGAVVYAIAFAAVIAPVAFAALGNRTRGGGYLALLTVLVVPEAAVRVVGTHLPGELAELCAIPSALAALREAVSPGAFDPSRLLRAALVLGVVVVVAALVARRESTRALEEAA